MGDFCNNCDQEVKIKSYTTSDILILIFSPIILPILLGFTMNRIADVDFSVGSIIGFGIGLVVSVVILYQIATQKKKICPICKDSNF